MIRSGSVNGMCHLLDRRRLDASLGDRSLDLWEPINIPGRGLTHCRPKPVGRHGSAVLDSVDTHESSPGAPKEAASLTPPIHGPNAAPGFPSIAYADTHPAADRAVPGSLRRRHRHRHPGRGPGQPPRPHPPRPDRPRGRRFLSLTFFGIPCPMVILAAGLIGWALGRIWPALTTPPAKKTAMTAGPRSATTTCTPTRLGSPDPRGSWRSAGTVSSSTNACSSPAPPWSPTPSSPTSPSKP